MSPKAFGPRLVRHSVILRDTHRADGTALGDGASGERAIFPRMSDERMNLAEAAPGEFTVSGEIDAHSAESFANALEAAGDDLETIVVDLSGVTFIDSSGLRVLVGAQQRSNAGGPSLVLRSPSHQIVRLLDLAGLAETFDIQSPA